MYFHLRALTKIKSKTTKFETQNNNNITTRPIMKFTSTISFFFLSIMATSSARAQQGIGAGGLRGSTSVNSNAGTRLLGSKDETNIQYCGMLIADADNDKYFWMTLANGSGDVKGSCLLSIPKGKKDGKEVCCTVQGTTEYNSDWNLGISDPYTVTDKSSAAYKYCGINGGSLCPDYNFNKNQQGFGHFRIRDEKGNSLREMDKFTHGKGNSGICGMTDKLGTCASGAAQVYGHVHVGKKYCLESVVTLEHHCDGHYGYQCKNYSCD